MYSRDFNEYLPHRVMYSWDDSDAILEPGENIVSSYGGVFYVLLRWMARGKTAREVWALAGSGGPGYCPTYLAGWGYGFNYSNLGNMTTDLYVNTSEVWRPAQTICMADNNAGTPGGTLTDAPPPSVPNPIDGGWVIYSNPGSTMDAMRYVRHTDGANFLWLDGHVSWETADRVKRVGSPTDQTPVGRHWFRVSMNSKLTWGATP